MFRLFLCLKTQGLSSGRQLKGLVCVFFLCEWANVGGLVKGVGLEGSKGVIQRARKLVSVVG